MNLLIKLLPFLLIFSYQFGLANEYKDLLKNILDLKPSSSLKYDVKNMFFQKDQGTFELKEGEFYVYNQINGKYCFAEFVGKGEFSFMPPITVEMQQLEREYETDFYTKSFSRMFIFFSDGFENFLKENAKLNKRLSLKNSYKNRALQFFLDKKQTEINSLSVVKSLMETKSRDVFYALVETDDKEGDENYEKEFVWSTDEYDIEESRFYKVIKSPNKSFYNDYLSPVTQFHKLSDYDLPNKQRQEEDKDEIKIDKYQLKVNIPKNLYFSAEAIVNFTSKVDGEQWIKFNFGPKLEIKELSSNGKEVYFHLKEKGNSIWIKLNETMEKGKEYSLKFVYEGDILNRRGDWFIINNFVSWYPKYGFYKKSQFELEFNTYRTYRFTTSGEKLSEEKKGEFNLTKWLVDNPSIHVAFNLGVFKEKELEAVEGKHPDMLIHYINSDLVDNVAIDLKQSYEFFTKIFGPISGNKFFATEIPSAHGQAFPNFLHLSFLAFQSRNMAAETFSTGRYRNDFFEKTLISHEMAHQWWANIQTYRDVWISEGFAEYASMMYAQISMEDQELFFNILKDKRQRLYENSQRKKPGGPIGIGTRLGRDYQIITYDKGSYVLHMLRNQLLDLRTMNDSNFINLMGGFFKLSQGKAVTTEDFIDYAEQFLNADLTWFFDQWVYGYKVPLYKFAWKQELITEGAKKGNYKVKVRILTENVDENFFMSIPMTIVFGSGDKTYIRRGVSGNIFESEFISPLKVDEIIFNTFESVLCGIEYEDWN